MKLANVGALTDGFVTNLSEAGYFDDPLAEGKKSFPARTMREWATWMQWPTSLLKCPTWTRQRTTPWAMTWATTWTLRRSRESLPPEVVAKVEDASLPPGAMEQELEDAIPELDLSVEQGDDMMTWTPWPTTC